MKEEGPVAAVVETGQAHRAADRRPWDVPDAGAALECKRIAGAEEGSRVIVKYVSVEFVASRFGDDRDLADRAKLGGVVGHIDSELLKAFDVGDERADLSAVGAVADCDAVDRGVGLVCATAGKATRGRPGAGLNDAGRETQVIPELALLE